MTLFIQLLNLSTLYCIKLKIFRIQQWTIVDSQPFEREIRDATSFKDNSVGGVAVDENDENNLQGSIVATGGMAENTDGCMFE